MAGVLPYASVNDAINDVFFDGRFAAQPVYLSMDNGIRDEIATLLGVDPEAVAEAICESVRSTLPAKGDLYGRHTAAAKFWRLRGRQGPPPFTALLFTQAFAAEQMEEEGSFASHNYYHRLSKVTGRDRDELTAPMRAAEFLWLELNEWLKENNYAMGRPTAFTNGSTFRYVDWPISQAIVRASDRDRFHDLYERFGFSGSEVVTRQEMAHYLANWIPARAPNSRLKRAWDKTELRDRVVEAAIAELSTWSASGTAGAATARAGRAKRLSLVANIASRFPRPRVLELHLGYQGDQLDPVHVTSEDGSFQISNEHFGSIATLSPSPFAGSGEALGHRHTFEDGAHGRKFDWDPRLVIPFSMPAQHTAGVELSRVGFGTPHMLLVRDTKNLPAIVETFLLDKVSKFPTRDTPAQLSGLPEGWVLYTNVQLRVADVVPPNDDLECLVPVGAGTVLDFGGGLELLRGIYHPAVMPVARMAAPMGSSLRIDAHLIGETTAVASASAVEEARLDLAGLGDGKDGLVINGYLDDKLVELEEVLLRDANRATPLRRDGKGLLEYTSTMSATPPADLGLAVVGMTVNGELPVPSTAVAADIHTEVPAGETESFQEVTYSQAVEGHAPRKACVHLWPFEMVPPNTPRGTPFKSTCAYCNQTLTIIYRERKKPSAVTTPKPVVRQFELPPMPAQDEKQGAHIDHDTLMDALSCLGSGSWGKFESLLEALSPEPQYARQVAQDYAMLGLLDIEQRRGSGAIRSWCVPPPTLNITPSGRVFLSGFRSSQLIDEVRDMALLAGGTVVVEGSDRAPAGIFIDGLDADALHDAVGNIEDPHGRSVAINEAPGADIATACLALGGIEESLSPVSIGRARNLQKFDLARARWNDVEEVHGSGCYRWNDGFQAYAFVDAGGRGHVGSYQATKLLAARASHVRLHAHDANSGAFISSLGCEPPGLLSRALVACSGRLPAIERGMTAYQGVTPGVASIVLKALYGGNE